MIRICQLMVMKLGICVQSCPSLFQLKSRRNKFKYIRVKKILHMTSDILKVKLTIIFSVSYCAKILSGKCKNSQQYENIYTSIEGLVDIFRSFASLWKMAHLIKADLWSSKILISFDKCLKWKLRDIKSGGMYVMLGWHTDLASIDQC